MTKLLSSLTLVALGFLVSCSDIHTDGAQLTSEVSLNTPKAEKLYNKGYQSAQKGKWKDAATTYDLLGKKYPTYKQSAEANYLAATYWEKLSKPTNAFASYQNYIVRFRNGKNYKNALERQADIAFSAAKGGLAHKFLGLKSDLQYNNVVPMLEKVRDNAPASNLAAKAQFAIGTYSEGKNKEAEAVNAYFKVVDAYPSHSLAPEATYRAGKVLAGFSEGGNQNSSNLTRAKNTLQDLIQQYPSSSQAKEAKSLLKKISGNGTQNIYEVAEFYEKKGKIQSAKYYYQEVLSKTQKGSHFYIKAQERLNSL